MSLRKPQIAVLALAALAAAALLAPAAARADFGVRSFSTTARNADGSLDNRAGSHPYEYVARFEMNQDAEGTPEGHLRNLLVDLPAGMTGNPLAVPRCPAADFEGGVPRCPGDTQVGVAKIKLAATLENAFVPVYNLTPRPGVIATLGLSIANINGFEEASLRPSDYGVRISDITIPSDKEIQWVEETIWGVPMEASHDHERFCPLPGSLVVEEGCKSEVAPEAFLTLPTACAGPLQTRIAVESVEEPGVLREARAESRGEGGAPEGLNGCDRPAFEPTISSRPETAAADTPTGLDFSIHLPQAKLPQIPQAPAGSGDPEGTATATAQLKDATVTLPAGLAVNPSSAQGLEACSAAQIGLGTAAAPTCPAASAVGGVEARSPAVDHVLGGTVYLARQGENPFGSLLAIYIVISDPATGVLVKLAGKVEPDPSTGQLRTIVADNPQQPIEDIALRLQGGPRATLTTPATCGTYTTQATLVPWTTPEGPTAYRSDSFRVSSGAGGAPCTSSEGELPNSPSFEAGTQSPLAGLYSPFVLKLTRADGSQRLGALNVTLPPGLTGRLAGTAECSDAQIAQAAARSEPGEGALERSSPSCPAGSELGTVTVGAGSGSPLYVQGHAYLAGPYKGAPLSMAIITPAIAGPFDLGTVVVRSALYVNEETAQITVKSDPIPTILHGIPLDVRSVAVQVSREAFTLNPTSCEAEEVGGEAISTTGAVARLHNRFQVGGCGGLGFAPKLALRFRGATGRTKHPALRGVLTPQAGQANISSFSFALPPTVFIDQFHISNPCTRPQFAEGKCPKRSVLGKVKAWTPLLEKPLEGPVYFRANGGARKLPDVVADLHGQIHVVSVGFVDAIHKKGSEQSRVRTRFATVPDAPLSRIVFELKGGKKYGLLVNSQNLCKTKVSQRAIVKMRAHNGKVHDFNPLIANSCKKKKKKK